MNANYVDRGERTQLFRSRADRNVRDKEYAPLITPFRVMPR